MTISFSSQKAIYQIRDLSFLSFEISWSASNPASSRQAEIDRCGNQDRIWSAV
jgi:hypothetical protein